MTTLLPTDAMMTAWRLQGRFTCTCTSPEPTVAGPAAGHECRLCAKLIVGRVGVELIERLVRTGVAS